MKVLKLSDEDYQALLGVLETAASNARAIEWEVGDCRDYSEDEQEANRLHDLIKPVDYEPHALEILLDPDFKYLKQALGITEED